ncbi:transforming growth factor-beta receptor-associated protein 1 [Mantella aurantiaca]
MSVQAFRLVCASGKEHLPAGIQIECLECSGHDLYIGTTDGCIHHLLLVEENGTESAGLPLGQQSDYPNTSFTTTRQTQRQLGVKKPICELRAASALGRLLVLCDNTISLLCSDSLEPVPGTKIRGVLSFTLNENPVSGDPFSVEVCLISSKRRTVQIFSVGQERVQIVREVATPEQPCSLAADGYYLCLALSSRYVILNYSTGHCQDLFPYPSEQKRPIIKRISRQEFLLAGPGGLGMFATVAGISQRAPVRWSENVIGAAVSFPYVLALDEEFITVHSMLDQQQKQSLPFKEGVILQDFEGRVIVATTNGLYVLIPLPLEKQIQDLLSNQRVEEALVLAKGARRNIPKEKFQVMYRRILQQAGFIQFAQLQFLEAKELFSCILIEIELYLEVVGNQLQGIYLEMDDADRDTQPHCTHTAIKNISERKPRMCSDGAMLSIKEKPVILSEKKLCHLCRKPFQEPVFARHPNGHIVHTHCATNQHINSSIDHEPSQSKRT